MNPVAFIVALALIGFIFPLFKGMGDDCFYAAEKAVSKVDAVFQAFLGILLMVVFCGLCVGILFIGTQPKVFFQ